VKQFWLVLIALVMLGCSNGSGSHEEPSEADTDPALADHRTVVARLTERMVERIDAELALAR
jgi:hypothetical protein